MAERVRMINRREVVTGHAAVAAASALPAFPACAAPVALPRFARTLTEFDEETRTLREAARLLNLRDLWHVEWPIKLTGFDSGIFRHVESGLVFVSDHERQPTTGDYLVLRIHQLATPAATVDPAHELLIAVAAFHLAALTTMFRQPARLRRLRG